MGRTVLLGILAATSLASPGFARGDGPVVLEPSSRWQLDYAPARCNIAMTFGEGEQRNLLSFEQMTPSRHFAWLVAGPAIKALGSRTRLTVQFGPHFAPMVVDSDRLTKGAPFGVAFRGFTYGPDEAESAERDEPGGYAEDGVEGEPTGLPELDAQDGARIEWIELSRKDRSYRFETGNLEEVFKAMNKCMADLVSEWGLDPEVMRTRSTAPRALNLRAVAARIQGVYPSKAERSGEQADLHIRVMVDEAGRVTECAVASQTVAENFDDTACQVFMRHARFEPARDRQGKAMASFYMTRVLYRLH